jgi:hypothetical protein
MEKQMVKFIQAISHFGYGPCFYFGDIGCDCGGCPVEDMPLSIVIRPAGFLGGCQIVGRGTWKNLQVNIQRFIEGKKPNLILETNPPSKNLRDTWYIYSTDDLKEKVLGSDAWNIITDPSLEVGQALISERNAMTEDRR